LLEVVILVCADVFCVHKKASVKTAVKIDF
jgi:hypothetical protein